MNNYQKQIMNHIYWSTKDINADIPVRKIRAWFRRKFNNSSDKCFNENIQKLVSEKYLSYSNYATRIPTSLTDENGKTIRKYSEQEQLDIFEQNRANANLKITDKGFAYYDENKGSKTNAIRIFVTKTGLSSLISYFIVSLLFLMK